jgi:hypothetical protein
MSDATKPGTEAMAAWAKSYGLHKLKPEHIARMAELAVYVADLGRSLPRVPHKEDAPAPVFTLPS